MGNPGEFGGKIPVSCHFMLKLCCVEWTAGGGTIIIAKWIPDQGGQWMQWEGLGSVLKFKPTRSPDDCVVYKRAKKRQHGTMFLP